MSNVKNSKETFRSSIHKGPDGKYRVDYTYRDPDNGQRRRTCKRGFKLFREASQWRANEMPAVIEQLEHKETLDENLTMAELIEEYMEYTKVRRRESTTEMKDNIIRTKITPYFGKKVVFDITKNEIRTWQDNLLTMTKSNGQPYSATYLRTINNQLSAILNYAVMYHNLPSNPVLQMERIGTKMPEHEREFWTLEEYLKFSEAIEDKPECYYAFQVLFWCGIRMGELLALTRKDIDLEEGLLHIRNSYSKTEKANGKTKTPSSVRTVHMPQELTDELTDYIDSLYKLDDADRVFPLSKTELHKIMTEGSEKAGVKRITIHGLRHSHISLLMNYVNCASVMDIAKRAGHKSPDVTMIYTHQYSNKDEIIAEELDDMMRGDVENVSKK